MNRTLAFGVVALAVAACGDRPNAPTSPRAEAPRAARVGAPPPSPLVAVPLPGQCGHDLLVTLPDEIPVDRRNAEDV